ncbi:MAG TPA: MmgE/PrpD family protein [Bryobacteraceae bacterium]|jgi:2-methylcitrate dehydratase PrpD|nr:MmgE/PrpD family protein [Bryobacteraceae bacterium]
MEEHGGLTRRRLLGGIAGAAGVAAIPTAIATAAEPASPVMTRLSTYMSEAAGRALPGEVIEKTKHHILDTLAAMISGSELPPGRAAIQFARSYGGEKVATVAGSNILCGPIEAALVNGVLAHADETDDSWPGGWHPGCNVVPAALATGEQFGISGTQFLRAVALGYDVGARVLTALRPGVFDTHKSTHSIGGVFGAAAAAGCAAALNAQQMRWLLDYTAQQSSGIAAWDRDSDHIEKGFVFGGMPARSGVTSALLVHSGWNGIDDVLSGDDNFLLANSPHGDAALLVDKLGERYEITRTSIKKWSVGSPIQAPLDALEILLKRRPFEPDQVKEVTVRMNPGSVVDNREMPDVCIQHMIAVMLVDKTVTFRSAHDKPRMRDAAILRQRAKVRLDPTPSQPLVSVTLADGTRLSEDAAAVLGTANNPMTRGQVVAKCRDLMTPVIRESATKALIERTLDLENVSSVRGLRPLLQRT